jgi:hypothetical protein
MPFLPPTASFPHSSERKALRGNAPRVAPGTPAWARPAVSWPFLAGASLASRGGDVTRPSTMQPSFQS